MVIMKKKTLIIIIESKFYYYILFLVSLPFFPVSFLGHHTQQYLLLWTNFKSCSGVCIVENSSCTYVGNDQISK